MSKADDQDAKGAAVNQMKNEVSLHEEDSSSKAKKKRASTDNTDNADNADEAYVERTQMDVLCGRGIQVLHHVGNLRLHLAANELREEYLSSRRDRKREIIKDIVRQLRSNGSRFLRAAKKDKSKWIEASDEFAYHKVSHVLRGQNTGKAVRKIKSDEEASNEVAASLHATGEQRPHPSQSQAFSSGAGVAHAQLPSHDERVGMDKPNPLDFAGLQGGNSGGGTVEDFLRQNQLLARHGMAHFPPEVQLNSLLQQQQLEQLQQEQFLRQRQEQQQQQHQFQQQLQEQQRQLLMQQQQRQLGQFPINNNFLQRLLLSQANSASSTVQPAASTQDAVSNDSSGPQPTLTRQQQQQSQAPPSSLDIATWIRTLNSSQPIRADKDMTTRDKKEDNLRPKR
ncbi:unnamed protein product [Cylindrotheca closterium]|uniref:DUF6824 domain-containing protein n=1 Tax=Cylindrotheca closterium TaxID=2856 RepID=A0AAD2CMM1_9STRA|nr:unnamed protein product [Cylindrotheca closterium]